MILKIITDGEYQFHLQLDWRDAHVGEKTIWFRYDGLQNIPFSSLRPRRAVVETTEGIQYVVTRLLVDSEGFFEVSGEILP